MTVAIQILSKVLETQDYSFIENNLIEAEQLVGFTDEFNFITEHYKKYGNVPDKLTFLTKFPEFQIVDVTESDKYLLDTLREEYLYYKSVPIVQQIAKLMESDANAAAEYMMNAVKTLQPNYSLGGINIIAQAMDRYDQFVERKSNPDSWYFTTGFPELDDIVHGFQRGEELVLIFARVNQGKSWILEKICVHIWQLGFNVGYISPEMSAISVGYRFDTLYKHFSNSGLMRGKDTINEEEYKSYITDLSGNKSDLIVSTPLNFNKVITITKLRQWVQQNKLDAIAIDGITYLSDERYKRGDNKTTSLTNISEDLMTLSVELGIPVFVVMQANRTGVIDKDTNGTPELESMRDSDGPSHNASMVFSLRQKDNNVEIGIKKQRFGVVGGKVIYSWDIDTGEFVWVPSEEDATDKEVRDNKIIDARDRFKGDKSDVF